MKGLKRIVLGLLVTTALVGIGVAVALIAIPDHDEIPDNVLTADAGEIIDVSVSPATALLGDESMLPGDIVCAIASLSSQHPFPLRTEVAVTHAASNAFTSALVLNITEASTCSSPFVNADGTATPGPSLYHGSYDGGGVLASSLVPTAGAGALRLAFSVVLPNTVDFTTVYSMTDTATIIFDTTKD